MASTTIALVRSHHHGHSSDVPWPWIVGYIAIGLIAWVIAAVLLVRHEQAASAHPVDGEQRGMAVVGGMVAGIAWPLGLVAYGVWRIVQRLTTPRVDLTKNSDRHPVT